MVLNSDELKERLGSRAKDIIANGIGLEFKGKMCRCPIHDDKNPSMSWFEQGLMFRCHACDAKIDIYSYLMEWEHMEFKEAVEKVADMVGERIDFKEAKKTVKPNIKTDQLSDAAIKYMEKRKIKKETLDALGVKERNWDGKQVYVFEYFNENKELEFVSYRGIGKNALKGGCEKNTKSILWGMDSIDANKPVVITEGQPDRMAIWQSGYKNVVSVPSGSQNLKWIENCWEWIQTVKEWIVWADNDEPGKKMASEINNRLKNVKILLADRKDANEVLFYDGPEKVLELINDKIKEKPKGIIDVADLEYKSYIDCTEETIETGFFEYDKHVEDWKLGELTIIFGRNGEGKTTFISQIIGHCISEGVKTFLYNGEMSARKLQDWLYRQIAGAQKDYYITVDTKYGPKKELKKSVVAAIKEWHQELLYVFDLRVCKKGKDKIDEFFNAAEIAVRKYGVKLIVIDNLMAMLEENSNSVNADQGNLVQRCKEFAVNNNIHIVLLCHPNKEKKEITGEDGNLEKNDISGTGNIPNKADNIIAIERVWADERNCDVIISSLKDRESGQRKVLKMLFSKVTLRFYNGITPQTKNYSWTKLLKEEVINPDDCPF